MIFALALAVAAPATLVVAEGHWAALERSDGCAASSAALAPAREGRPQARIAIQFDRLPRGRNGEVAVLLSRPARPGSSALLTIGDRPFLLALSGTIAWSRGPAQEAQILAALRAAPSARIDARGVEGTRIIDRYVLDGAPTAIDAAAACAARRPGR